MLHTKRGLIFLLAVFPMLGSAQMFVRKTINFNDSINSRLSPCHADNLATLLIDGYLQGKLRGYKFDIGTQVLKRAPITESLPDKWGPGIEYFEGDRVQYEGQFFELAWDNTKSFVPPPKSSEWRKFEILGEPISTRYYFPSQEDTLSKKDFFYKMVLREPQRFEEWRYDYDYYTSDVVTWGGSDYEASQDHKGQSPPNSEYWWRTSAGNIIFFYPDYLSKIRIVHHVENKGGTTTRVPIILSIIAYNENIDQFFPLGLHFYFRDVVAYLDRVQQPVFYSSETGNIGSNFILSDSSSAILVRRLWKELKNKSIKQNKKDILNLTLYNKFLAEVSNAHLSSGWKILQSPTTGNLQLNKVDWDDNNFYEIHTAVATFPLSKLKQTLDKQNVQLISYSQALLSDVLKGSSDTLRIDTLIVPVMKHVPTQVKKNSHFWLEQYMVNVDSSDMKTQQELKVLWTLLSKAHVGKKLKTKQPFVSFYPCRAGVNEELTFSMKNWYVDSDFEFGRSDQGDFDSLLSPLSFRQYSVTYKKVISTDPGKQVEYIPYELSFHYTSEVNNYPFGFTLNWNEAKAILEQHPSAATFIRNVQTAGLNFSGSQITYGLIQDKPNIH